jgi:hypothetical protein
VIILHEIKSLTIASSQGEFNHFIRRKAQPSAKPVMIQEKDVVLIFVLNMERYTTSQVLVLFKASWCDFGQPIEVCLKKHANSGCCVLGIVDVDSKVHA